MPDSTVYPFAFKQFVSKLFKGEFMKSRSTSNQIPIAEISQFQMIKPKFMIPQEIATKWIESTHQQAQTLTSEESHRNSVLFKKYSIKPLQISNRGFEIDDVNENEKNQMQIYGSSGYGSDIEKRNQYFLEKSENILTRFYDDKEFLHAKQPDHIIHVTCTGYVSPSAVQRLVTQKKWSPQTGLTHAYHMGCYAALPSVRMAEGLMLALEERNSSETKINKQVDIVHTEICSLHMNPMDNTPEQIVVQSLFADGFIKYSVSKAGSCKEQNKKGFSILNITEQLVESSQEDMSWIPASWGMRMTLSREVPSKIKNSIKPFLENLIRDSEYDLAEILKNAIFAIHPGGPKIISSLQEILELSEDQVADSKKILFERGNMSSATLPHVWQSLMENKYESGKIIVSLAFGPGLTIFGALFKMI